MVKFDVVIGNPPYQNGNTQIYTDFYVTSIGVANNVCLIFPTGWQDPKNANNLSKMNKESIKRDPQIVGINNIQNVFSGVAGAEWTNIITWKKGYDNGLDGKQRLLTEGRNVVHKDLPINKSDLAKPDFIEQLVRLVEEHDGFKSISEKISSRKPYGLSSDILKVDTMDKYGLPPIFDTRKKHDDIRLFSPKGFRYVYNDYPFPKMGLGLRSYKVFVPFAWGNWSTTNGLGGAYADIYIAQPNDACTETYLECGSFDSEREAMYLAKYLMTRFTRALIFKHKFSHNNTRVAYTSVPKQDFTEDWWNLSIEEINEKLFDKYGIPQDVRDQVNANIQTKDESNIITL